MTVKDREEQRHKHEFKGRVVFIGLKEKRSFQVKITHKNIGGGVSFKLFQRAKRQIACIK